MEPLSSDNLLQAYDNGDRQFAGIDLSAAQLFEADLRHIDLQASCLNRLYAPYSNFSQGNLQAVTLMGAELGDSSFYGADLSQAILTNASLSRADLRAANFGGANLRGANLQGADLRQANLTSADLEGANLQGANLEGTILKDANLSRCNLFRAVGLALDSSRCDRTTILPDGHTYDT
ncbi:pentapeptide repeat-containing protein [Nodosilinea sp. P-1105]|uniref:pentapeptide repeat-containing protein n=1 Tax=Nodosilinea sp. P-1105 TaxID=2546229 RepID=UPI00146BEF73|nr:pentapeptide repeat-containing protein [Nodosilinea sp. P-1105]NMF84467.1 pentapeptide repeat-containing protein [Nodosilinea sp. P-1105]